MVCYLIVVYLSNFPMIDTHAHLMFVDFDADREEVIERAFSTGVKRIVNISCDEKSADQAIELAGQYDGLYATVGLHPYEAADLSVELMEKWKGVIRANDKVLAIGETGLDYFKAQVDHQLQEESFRQHLKLAEETGLPVVVHNRDADEDCLALLREFPEVRAVFHCYGSDLEFARKLWGFGYYTSFTGIVTFKNADALRAVVKEVPEGLFMVETDCPYLAPQAYRGKRNEPAYVQDVIEEIARVRGLSFEDVAQLSVKNAEGFFRFS